MTLVEALQNVELEPGRTYQCHVRGMDVEVRVNPAGGKWFLPAPLHPDDIMLEAWCELPGPRNWVSVSVPPGSEARFLPDPPVLPPEGE